MRSEMEIHRNGIVGILGWLGCIGFGTSSCVIMVLEENNLIIKFMGYYIYVGMYISNIF